MSQIVLADLAVGHNRSPAILMVNYRNFRWFVSLTISMLKLLLDLI